MLLVERLVECGEREGVLEATVGPDHPFLREDGTLHPLAAVELVAQAAAACHGFRRRARGLDVGGGFLVGIREFVFAEALRPGDRVRIVARRGFEMDPLRLAEGSVWLNEREVARGELKIYLTERAERGGLQGLETSAAAPPRLPSARASSIFPLPGDWGRSLETGEIGADYRLDGSFAAFHGHFPDFAILPAVAITALAVEAVRAQADPGAEVGRVVSGKFLRAVLPGESLRTVCVRGEGGSGASWSARVESGSSLAASVSFEMARSETRPHHGTS